MKKLLLAVLFVATSILGFSADLTPVELELTEQLEFANSMKDHYRIMATYAEQEKALALIEIENFKEHTGNLYLNLSAYKESNDVLKGIIDSVELDKARNTDHFTQLLAGYENMLYERVQELQVADYQASESAKTISDLEDRLNTSNIRSVILLTIILISFIFYLTNQLKGYLLNRTPAEKTEPVETTTEPLTIVKDTTKKESKPETKKETTGKKETKVKEEVATVERPPLTVRFSMFLNSRKAKRDLKAQDKLAKRKAKALELQKGDKVEEVDTIKENNKGLAGGVMGNFIKSILSGWNFKAKEEEPVETEEEKIAREKQERKDAQKARREANKAKKAQGAKDGKTQKSTAKPTNKK